MVGEQQLSFYDAISPIVLAESIDMSKVFRGSRWDRGTTDEGDYLNCPMSKAEYDAFYNALVAAGLLEDPRAMLNRLNGLLEKLLAKDGTAAG